MSFRNLISIAVAAWALLGAQIALAAFPTQESAATTSGASGTSHTINYPATVSAGATIVACLANSSATTTHTWPAQFSSNVFVNQAGGSQHSECAWEEAAGDEDGGTFSVSTSGTATVSARVWSFTGAIDPDTQAPEGTVTSSGAATIDPPSLTPTGGAADFHWIVWVVIDSNRTCTNEPTNFTDESNLNLTAVSFCADYRQTNAASQDPDGITPSASETWTAATIAIHPAAATALLLRRRR